MIVVVEIPLKAFFLDAKRRENGLAYHMRMEEAYLIHFPYQL